METNYDALIQTSADELFQRMSSGDEVIGFRNQDGDSLVAVSFDEDQTCLYPVRISVRAIDRYHLLSDLEECITE